ncbi:6119_t:CDS:2 [Racocetra fulgida]|uniref:6119_t:CDS:1 n=1 Tax=Racocetra fulgida TaxID=60492 RepID=A0A9N9ADG3_9GLOM|nr:6119_t:CDS:2 [Racocetra fulgida]
MSDLIASKKRKKKGEDDCPEISLEVETEGTEKEGTVVLEVGWRERVPFAMVAVGKEAPFAAVGEDAPFGTADEEAPFGAAGGGAIVTAGEGVPFAGEGAPFGMVTAGEGAPFAGALTD